MRRLLVVEDDPAIGPMIKEILRLEGFEVVIEADGMKAVSTLRSSHFDGAILDVMLPGKDGISILKEIRADASFGRIPVVMLTAKIDDTSTWEGWKAGCDCYLPKPFDPEELVSVVKRLQFVDPSPATNMRGR